MSELDITLPDAAWEGVDQNVEALLDAWLMQPGDHVEAGQPVARVVLVKTNIDIVAPANGTIAGIAVQAGETFGRGQALGSLRSD
ncbi:MAG: lipoyl domain-containing protein [Burkholderiales bacterium]|nr:lipoyl domain-containing protein [Burkholderiales bacterium]ODU63084.1 MAG: hypothetical protein ABT05_06110 [Lautropia sp. SCN 66-9]